jgi:hypothetical protein
MGDESGLEWMKLFGRLPSKRQASLGGISDRAKSLTTSPPVLREQCMVLEDNPPRQLEGFQDILMAEFGTKAAAPARPAKPAKSHQEWTGFEHPPIPQSSASFLAGSSKYPEWTGFDDSALPPFSTLTGSSKYPEWTGFDDSAVPPLPTLTGSSKYPEWTGFHDSAVPPLSTPTGSSKYPEWAGFDGSPVPPLSVPAGPSKYQEWKGIDHSLAPQSSARPSSKGRNDSSQVRPLSVDPGVCLIPCLMLRPLPYSHWVTNRGD